MVRHEGGARLVEVGRVRESLSKETERVELDAGLLLPLNEPQVVFVGRVGRFGVRRLKTKPEYKKFATVSPRASPRAVSSGATVERATSRCSLLEVPYTSMRPFLVAVGESSFFAPLFVRHVHQGGILVAEARLLRPSLRARRGGA